MRNVVIKLLCCYEMYDFNFRKYYLEYLLKNIETFAIEIAQIYTFECIQNFNKKYLNVYILQLFNLLVITVFKAVIPLLNLTLFESHKMYSNNI